MKLTIELVPKSSWYSNVRSNVSQAEWDKIRRTCYKRAGHKCEICGGVGPKWPVECHEMWHYDDVKNIQKLYRIIALCPNCHKVKHIGLASINGEFNMATDHLAKINNISHAKAIDYVESAFEIWERRSQEDWKLDISYLERYFSSNPCEWY